MITKDKVVTVDGPVEPSSLGVTLPHEHLSLDFSVVFTPHPDGAMATAPLTIPNLGWVRQNPYSHRDNLKYCGAEVDSVMLGEVEQFRALGGGCIVENTTHGIRRNASLIKKLAHTSGVQMVAGTGFYVDVAQSSGARSLKTEQLTELISEELSNGSSDDSTVKCGIIGEVGCSFPLTEFERSSIRACAAAQAEFGCPVMFHPGRHRSSPGEVLRLYAEAGGSVPQAVMGHLDRTIHDQSELLEFAELGSFLEYDLFGIETSHYQLSLDVDMPSDAQRIATIKFLHDAGLGERILLSHDIHTRHRLSAFGGHGFGHILKNVVPKMIDRGFSEEVVRGILTKNPQKWLTWTK